MSKLPILLGISLWLILGTCNSAAVVKRFLPGYPPAGYRPTFPWESFFKKSNDVSSSEYVNNDDVSSSEFVDADDSNEPSLETDDTDDVGQGYVPDKLYRDEPYSKDIDADDDTTYTDDSSIDDTDIGASDINVPDNGNHDLDANNIGDDIDYTDTNSVDADYNPVGDNVDDSDQDPLSDHLSYLPLEDEYLYDKLDASGEDDDKFLDRDRRGLRPWTLKLAPAAFKGMMVRKELLKGAIPTPGRNHGVTKHYEKAGGITAMTKDFYLVQPTKISDAVIDGHYVGKIGQVGDTRIHYFIHDHEHVDLRPFMSLQKMDKYGKIIEKDIIHYMD